jgi:hypothetical protein
MWSSPSSPKISSGPSEKLLYVGGFVVDLLAVCRYLFDPRIVG